MLVTHDGVPKLLDFGIAKLLNAELTGQTLAAATPPGLQLMTPEYASPEQVRGEQVTTATDVYSLGILLYELLTGRMPVSHHQPRRAGDRARGVRVGAAAAQRGGHSPGRRAADERCGATTSAGRPRGPRACAIRNDCAAGSKATSTTS